MNNEQMHQLAVDDLHTLATFFDRQMHGWYALVLWDQAAPNAIWITGPYESPDRARADAQYFQQSDHYPAVRTWHVAGTAIPPVTVIDEARLDEVSLTPDGMELGITILRTHEEGRDDEQRKGD
jgi:hypothetical protein